jgi:dihydrofolate reductase
MSASRRDVEPETGTGPRLALIVARARNGVIGRAGGLPWRLKADMKAFRRATLGKPVLMGRKTWDSLPAPLAGRENLVLSRDPAFRAEGAEAFSDFSAMLARARALAAQSGAEEVMVIGGEALYRLALPRADRLYLTEVDADVPGDARFPQFAEREWVEIERNPHQADTDNDHAFVVRVLDRTTQDRHEER